MQGTQQSDGPVNISFLPSSLPFIFIAKFIRWENRVV